MSSIRCTIGRHQVLIEQDVLSVRIMGPFLPDAATQLLQLADQQFREHGRVFLVADVSESDRPGQRRGAWLLAGRVWAAMWR